MPEPISFKVGQTVRLRERPDKHGWILEYDSAQHSARVLIAGTDGPATYDAAALVDNSAIESQFTSREALLARLARIKLRFGLADTMYAMGSARARFEVYQFKPAFKFLDGGCTAILIADEVGLGKTIEAGYIYLEMKARFPVLRTLVICPSGLRTKWRDELRIRFDEEFTILDAAGLRDFLARYKLYESATPLRGICSLELLRSGDFQEQFAELKVRFDLVIVDEAHHLRNPNARGHELIETIQAHTDALVFLTATPVQLGTTDLFSLLKLLAPGNFTDPDSFNETIRPNARINAVLSALAPPTDLRLARERFALLTAPDMGGRFKADPYFQRANDMMATGPSTTPELLQLQQDIQRLNPLSHILTRTRKAEVQGVAMRSPQTVKIALTPAEAAFYQAVVDFVRAQTAGQQWGVSGFALVMRERQVASCMTAAFEYFREFAGDRSAGLGEQGLDLTDELVSGLPRTEPSAGSLNAVLRAGLRLGDVDSKYVQFREALATAMPESRDRRAIVFSFFKRTLSYLERRLRLDGFEVHRIDGDVPPAERAERVDAFKRALSRRGAILLSSEVGSEGLDFQFCDTLFNYDLPWNPMRIEQRIGRLDRYGQISERIRITNFILEGTIEERVLERLYDRIDVFHEAIGDLEPILGETVSNLVRDLFERHLSNHEEKLAADRLEQALVRKKIDRDEFDSRRAELLGQDDAIMGELAGARENGRAVSPEELRCLLNEALQHTSFDRTRLGRSDRIPKGVWELAFGEPFVNAAVEELARKNVPAEGLQVLAHKVSQAYNQRVWLTFDSTVAQDNPLLAYLHPRHGLIQYAANLGDRAGREDALHYPGRLVVQDDSLSSGAYLLCVYLLDEQGANVRRRLWPVAVREDRAEPEIGRLLFGKLASSDTFTAEAGPLDSGIVQIGVAIADAAVSAEREAVEHEARRRNDAFLNQRLQAVERTAGAQIAQAKQRFQRADEPRIRRMYESRIANLQQRLENQRASYRHQQGIAIASELVCVAVVHVVAQQSSIEKAKPAPSLATPSSLTPKKQGPIVFEPYSEDSIGASR